MVYTTNIPQPEDNPSVDSQPQFLDNFNDIATTIASDHVAFNDPSGNQGEHSLVHFVRQDPPPAAAPVANANEGLIYAMIQNAASELFYSKDTGAAVQMTGIIPSTGGGTATSYSWDFASGLSIRMGDVVQTLNVTPILFDTAFTTIAYVVLINPQGVAATNANSNVDGLDRTGFNINSTGAIAPASRYFYIALGR